MSDFAFGASIYFVALGESFRELTGHLRRVLRARRPRRAYRQLGAA
jgi:hypothetical protein